MDGGMQVAVSAERAPLSTSTLSQVILTTSSIFQWRSEQSLRTSKLSSQRWLELQPAASPSEALDIRTKQLARSKKRSKTRWAWQKVKKKREVCWVGFPSFSSSWDSLGSLCSDSCTSTGGKRKMSQRATRSKKMRFLILTGHLQDSQAQEAMMMCGDDDALFLSL